MTKCKSKEKGGELCAADATFTVFWPGQTTESCDRHFIGQKRIAQTMGFALDARPFVEGEEKEAQA